MRISELMKGKVPGTVKIKRSTWRSGYFRPFYQIRDGGVWRGLDEDEEDISTGDDGDWQLYTEPKKMKTVWLWAWRFNFTDMWRVELFAMTESEMESARGWRGGEYIKCGASFEVPG